MTSGAPPWCDTGSVNCYMFGAREGGGGGWGSRSSEGGGG